MARQAAGDGRRVLLCERDDLASHTSSASTKLIHGGLRYLEHYDFALVRESLIERERLLKSAPHIIWPLRFVLPHDKGLRPKWLLRLGLFLYDHLGGRKILPPTKSVDLADPPFGGILQERLRRGFEYSDCWVEDSRLVVLFAQDARDKGADIRTRTEVTDLQAVGEGFRATLRDASGGQAVTRTVTARAVVNAAGPWVGEVLAHTALGKARETASDTRLVKGSHIIVPRHYAGEHCYIFQNADGRIVFAIPYERDFTLIGTTDVPTTLEAGRPEISDDEITYLCAAASEYFAEPVTPGMVVSTYSGVRPLYDDRAADAASVTRDYVLEVEETAGGAPLLSVYGGKITTSRHLAFDAVGQLDAWLGKARDWTRESVLPGGDLPGLDQEACARALLADYPALAPDQALRLVRAYGSRVREVLGAEPGTPLTPRLSTSLLPAEVRHMVAHEWARTAEDVLWRRSKTGLHMNDAERAAFAEWFVAEFGSGFETGFSSVPQGHAPAIAAA